MSGKRRTTKAKTKKPSVKKAASEVEAPVRPGPIVLTMSRGHASWLLGLEQAALQGMSASAVLEHGRLAQQFDSQVRAPAPVAPKKVVKRRRSR